MQSESEDLRQTLQQQLRDIQLPEPVSWWPPAIGWWLLVAVAIGVVTAIAWRYIRIRRALRIRRDAVIDVAAHYANWQQTHDDRAYIDQVNRLLRQVAIANDGRERVARLNGELWIRYLNGLSSQPLGDAMQRCLGTDRYRPTVPTLNIEQAHREINAWAKSLRARTHV